MTQDRMQLSELLEKAGADDIVRDMIGFVAQRLMELDVANRCGAAHGERSEERTNSRNGYRDRNWTRVPARLRCVSRSCARAATFRPSWSHDEQPRRRSQR